MELSYKLGYLITAAFFFLFVLFILLVLILSAFFGYSRSVNIIRILWIYPNFVYIICIGHIMSYLAHNVGPIFHIYSYSVSDWCITYFPVCNFICFLFPLIFALFFLSRYKLNPKPYVDICTSFYHNNKIYFSFSASFNIYIFLISDDVSTILKVPFFTLTQGLAQCL